MSIHHYRRAWKISGVTTHEKLVFLFLADMANKEKKCCPSRAHIAESTSIHPTTVSKIIRGLKAKGFVSSKREPGEGQVYTLHLPCLTGKEGA